MRELPIGWATDLAVLEHSGSTVEDRGDHVVVSTPANPAYHWGNCLFVTDPAAVDDAARWLETFSDAFPEAGWIAVGLVRVPDDTGAWSTHDVELEFDDVLSTSTLPRQTPLTDGYTVRRLDGDDWEQLVARDIAENERTGEHEPSGYAPFARARMEAQRSLSDRGVAAFFGAFSGETLAADLGIVRCGSTARYQSVGTEEGHRRRGLASHLLGVAARWAGGHGCDEWVIITEATNPAGRVYRSVGFERTTPNAQAYRKPPR